MVSDLWPQIFMKILPIFIYKIELILSNKIFTNWRLFIDLLGDQ